MGCIRTLSSHTKFALVKNEKWSLAIRTSMNLNENPRLENLEISDDPRLYGFLASVVDGVFEEHDESDFGAAIPDLAKLENVSIAGQVATGTVGPLEHVAIGKATQLSIGRSMVDDEVEAEVRKMLRPSTPDLTVEAIMRHVQSARRARVALEREGEIVSDGKNNPIPHPGLAIERDAHRQIRELAKPWLRTENSKPDRDFSFDG